MKINWTVRLKNKNFWLALVPAVDKILVFVNVLFAVFVLVGVVNDPTTTGLSDSTRALNYYEPNDD